MSNRHHKNTQPRGRLLKRMGEKGFSVIEMLVVFTIVGVAMLPLASVQFGSRQEVMEASRHSVAVQLAQAELEQMRSLGFGNALPDTTQQGNFNVATGVAPWGGVGSRIEELNVTISWQDGPDRRQFTISCLQAQR